jgi:sigma-B regulation protein RsbU (phosphoserine phosphatase)
MPEAAPSIEGIELAGKCLPANTVSGDFFDYLPSQSQNQIGIVVADVMGKAMKGAMNAVMTDGILHATAMEQGQFTPASLMMTLNNALKGRLEHYMNVTMVIGLIDAAPTSAKNNGGLRQKTAERSEHALRLSGEFGYTLTLANAGHHAYPILLRNGEIQYLLARGMPLGMMGGIKYTEEKYHLHRGDVLIFMTDGIIEAPACPERSRRDSLEQQYSESGRLERIIGKVTKNMSAEAIVAAILNDVMDFSGPHLQRDDDMTVVVARIQ